MLATMLSVRFLLVWLLVTAPMQDPLCFSAQSGPLVPDPGVNAGSFSVPNHLPGPDFFLEFLSIYGDYFVLMVKGLLLSAIFLTR